MVRAYALAQVFAVLYEQFRYFFNLYFLLVALSQLIPELQVGFLFTYIAPLVFVLSITLAKEGSDDYQRFCRDKVRVRVFAVSGCGCGCGCGGGCG